jgi:hypothetical protein
VFYHRQARNPADCILALHPRLFHSRVGGIQVVINWNIVEALGTWFGGLVTAWAIKVTVQQSQPKARIKVKNEFIVSNRLEEHHKPIFNQKISVKNIGLIPITIEDIGISVRKSMVSSVWFNQLTGKIFTGKRHLFSLYRHRIFEENPELPLRLDQSEGTKDLLMCSVRLAEFLGTHNYEGVVVIQYFIRDIKDRIFLSKRSVVYIPGIIRNFKKAPYKKKEKERSSSANRQPEGSADRKAP